MSTLDDWVAQAADALGVDKDMNIALVLDLARDVAHAVARPAAPVNSYLLGLAVAGGADPETAAATLVSIAREWPPA